MRTKFVLVSLLVCCALPLFAQSDNAADRANPRAAFLRCATRVPTDDEIGEALVSNPAVAKVCFTGSVKTGRLVARRVRMSAANSRRPSAHSGSRGIWKPIAYALRMSWPVGGIERRRDPAGFCVAETP